MEEQSEPEIVKTAVLEILHDGRKKVMDTFDQMESKMKELNMYSWKSCFEFISSNLNLV